MTEPVFIIAEAGVNHNGDTELAKQLIDVAADSGASAVKFQTFSARSFVSRTAPKADYQTITTDQSESQFEMIKRLELTEEDHELLIDHAEKRAISFLSSPFDRQSLHLLTKRLGLRIIKIPSGEITNGPFLIDIARVASRVILSTGMCTLADVELALGALAFGFTSPKGTAPKRGSFDSIYTSEAGYQSLRDRVTLLHCTTEYPAVLHEVNLRAMDTLAAAFSLDVGYSDHTRGFHISLAAVARGARVLEKHFTLDRNLPGPDHESSLEPSELKELVRQAREIELSLGDSIKRPMPSELKNRAVLRKSLVAARSIRSGEIFSNENLTCKRPGTGVSPMLYWQTVGQKSGRGYLEDELIEHVITNDTT